jgi:DNA-binding NarL/FixJ family response regulator
MKTSDKSLSVFLVDDDTLFLTALKHHLREKFKSAIKIHTFSRAQECLSHIQEKPDLVVLDYYLDNDTDNPMDGIQVLRKIKEVSNETTVVMLSGQEEQAVVEESLRSGASQYLAKGNKAMVAIQKLLSRAVHDHAEERNKKENKQLNYITLAVFLLLAGIFTFLFFFYR